MADIVINGVTYPSPKRVAFPGSDGQTVVFALPEDADIGLSPTSTRPVQNKVIYEAVQEIHRHLTSPYNFKGALASASALPAASASNANDTYYLIQEKYRVTSNGETWEQSSMEETDYTDELAGVKTALDDRTLRVMYPIEGYTATGFYVGSGISNVGASTVNAARCRTPPLLATRRCGFVMATDEYHYKIYGFSGTDVRTSYFVRSVNEDFVPGTTPTFYPADCPYVAISFKRADEADMTDADAAAIKAACAFFVTTDLGLTTQGVPADAKVTGDYLSSLSERTTYAVNTSGLRFAFGGVSPKGLSTTSDTCIRYLSEDGKGGIPVLAGSVITPNPGYKCAVATYSEYVSNNNHVRIGYRGMSTDAYVVPYDCYVRIAVAAADDAILWEQDGDGLKTFTAAGRLAQSGLTLSLLSGTVKERIANIEAGISLDTPKTLDDAPPVNAADYYALWDDMVTSGYVTRTLLGYADAGAEYPIYLYTMRNDMDHLASNYSHVAWDGSNELYTRPKVLLTSGVHGNERTTPVSVYDFARHLTEDSDYQRLRNAFDWYFVPLVNPWGFSHSEVKAADGTIGNGTHYSSGSDAYVYVDNTESIRNGIRRNADGIDINRDFSAFETQEARIVKSLLETLTSDHRDLAFCIDAHQATTGSAVNVIGAFLSLHYGADDDAKNLIYKKWMQAGAETELMMANYVDVPPTQSVYPWDGSNLMTLRNYAAGYADYSMCFEGGQTCVYYSSSAVWSNPTARALVNTQYHKFLRTLAEHWM